MTIFAERKLPNLISLELTTEALMDTHDEKYGHPVFAAQTKGNKEALRALLRPSTLLPRAQNGEQDSMLITGKDLETAMDELLAAEKGDYEGHTTLSWAAIKGMHGVVRCFLASGKVDANRTFRDDIGQVLRMYQSTCGNWTTQAQHQRVQSFLIRSEIRLSEHFFRVRRTPLHLAVRHTQLGLIQLLLDHESIDVNKIDGTGNTPLHYAARTGSTQTLRLLLAHRRIDINRQNPQTRTTALHEAAQSDHVAIARLLLGREETAVNGPDKLGMTPLHHAVAGGSLSCSEVVVLLLARPDIKADRLDAYKRTPLDWAIALDRTANAALLQEHFGNNANSVASHTLMKLLRRAILLGSVEAVASLLQDQDMQFCQLNSSGLTPLHLAVRHRREEIVRLMIQHKSVRLDAPDACGQTALALAFQNGSFEIATLLSNAMHSRDHSASAIGPGFDADQYSSFVPQASSCLDRDTLDKFFHTDAS